MKQMFVALILLCAIAPGLRAQTPISQDSLLDRMVGHWVMQGTIARQQTTHDVDAEWVLNHGYLRLHEVSREKDAAGGAAYEAFVFIYPDKATGDYAVLWLDNTAAAPFPPDGVGHGKRVGDSIPLLFGAENPFHNTMSYNRQNDTWQWQMDNNDKGQLKPFARLTLTRKP